MRFLRKKQQNSDVFSRKIMAFMGKRSDFYNKKPLNKTKNLNNLQQNTGNLSIKR